MTSDNNISSNPLPKTLQIGTYTRAGTLAARLGVCSRTIFRWADAGKLHRYKINSRVVLFDEAEIVALLKSSRLR